MQTFKLLKRILQHPLRIHCWLDSSDSAAFFNTILKCLVLSVFIQQILSTFCFFAFEAATFNEYVESFFYLLGGCLMSSWYLTFLRQRNKFIDLSNDLDEIIESRELIHRIKISNSMSLMKCCFLGIQSSIVTTIYEKTDQQIETLTRIVHWGHCSKSKCRVLLSHILPFRYSNTFRPIIRGIHFT